MHSYSNCFRPYSQRENQFTDLGNWDNTHYTPGQPVRTETVKPNPSYNVNPSSADTDSVDTDSSVNIDRHLNTDYRDINVMDSNGRGSNGRHNRDSDKGKRRLKGRKEGTSYRREASEYQSRPSERKPCMRTGTSTVGENETDERPDKSSKSKKEEAPKSKTSEFSDKSTSSKIVEASKSKTNELSDKSSMSKNEKEEASKIKTNERPDKSSINTKKRGEVSKSKNAEFSDKSSINTKEIEEDSKIKNTELSDKSSLNGIKREMPCPEYLPRVSSGRNNNNASSTGQPGSSYKESAETSARYIIFLFAKLRTIQIP